MESCDVVVRSCAAYEERGHEEPSSRFLAVLTRRGVASCRCVRGRSPTQTEAVEAMLVGLDADPLNSLYRHHLAWGLRHAGRLQEAEAELRTVLDQDQGLVLARLTLSSICAQQGEVDEALELAEQAYAATPWNFHAAGHLAGMLARVGDTKRANRLVATLMPGGAYGAPLGLAVFHAERGDIDAAADWAARVVEQRQPVVVHILGPLLSGTPCWRDLLKMMNLPADQS